MYLNGHHISGIATYGILIKANRKSVMIPWQDIVLFEVDDNYIKIFIIDQTLPYLMKGCLKYVEQQLPASDFCRVHRSYIVGIRHIRHICPDLVNLGAKEVPLSRNHMVGLRSRFTLLYTVGKNGIP